MKDSLYILKAGEFYKIGYAQDVSKRIRDLKTGCPFPIQKIASFRMTNARTRETYLHRLWSNHRSQGEWFTLSNEELASILWYCELYRLLDTDIPVI